MYGQKNIKRKKINSINDNVNKSIYIYTVSNS